MDVILDSNRFLSDPKMEGNKFANLFDYLRRTGSELIVPRVVHEEVLARYKERLERSIQAARDAVEELESISSGSPKLMWVPEVDRELKALEARLKKPAERVKAVVHSDHCSVEISEVVRRGVHRIPPADQKGEELRDVILWLAILGYSTSTKPARQVAFITDDSHFWESRSLKSALQEEIVDRSAAVSVYRTIDEFIKKEAPAPTTASKEWVEKYVASERVEEMAVLEARNYLSHSLGRELTLVSGFAYSVEFQDGLIYQVAQESQFAELTFSFTVSLEVEERSISTDYLIANAPFLHVEKNVAYPTKLDYVFPTSGSFVIGGGVTQNTPTPIVSFLNQPQLFSGLGSLPGVITANTASFVTPVLTRSLLRALGTISVSLRVVEGTPSNIEFERIITIEFTHDSREKLASNDKQE